MVKVLLPLAGTKASGTIGKFLTYRTVDGVTQVKMYQKPAIKEYLGQVVQREWFADVTRMAGGIGLWGRSSLYSVVGSRWFQQVATACKRVRYIGGQPVTAWDWYAAVYQGFDEGDKQGYSRVAPVTGTKVEPGLLFCVVNNCLHDYLAGKLTQVLGFEGRFGWVLDEEGYQYEEVAAQWSRKLVDMVLPGMYEAEAIVNEYLAPATLEWDIVPDGHSGGYLAETGAGVLNLYFWGRRLRWRAQHRPTGGFYYWALERGGVEYESQYSEGVDYEVWKQTPLRGFGLHCLTLVAWGEYEWQKVNLDKFEVVA